MQSRSLQARASVTGASRSSATSVIKSFYECWNRTDIDGVLDCFAEDVVYHDTIYLEPYYGKEALSKFFDKFRATDALKDLKFVVTEITGDERSCSVAWHTELDGEFFPFSRGCSFYKLNSEGKIVWARDCVEAAPPKPGDGAVTGLSLLVPILRKVGLKNSDPANLTLVPFAAAAVWVFYAAYIGWVMLGTDAPGQPVWQVSPETLSKVYNESVNFFYINIGLQELGVAPLPSIPENPVSEALFNFVNAWSMMFLPVMLADQQSKKVNNVALQWVGTMFLTNVFFIPYLAQRAMPEPHPSGLEPSARTQASLRSDSAASLYRPQDAAEVSSTSARSHHDFARDEDDDEDDSDSLQIMARIYGALGLFVGGTSIVWAVLARPEYGDLFARFDFIRQTFSNDRVFYAFVLDAGLYGFWQAWLLKDAGAPKRYSAVPFFGIALYLLEGCPQESSKT